MWSTPWSGYVLQCKTYCVQVVPGRVPQPRRTAFATRRAAADADAEAEAQNNFECLQLFVG